MTDPLETLYDGLGRFTWWRRALRRAKPGVDLQMRKRLSPADGGPSSEALEDWIWTLCWPDTPPRVLDIGCGFGSSAHSAVTRGARSYLGLSSSGVQIRRARQAANAAGIDDRCSFRKQSYDAPIDGKHDLALSIEALLHSPDLAHTLANVARSLAPGSPVVLVEDMATDADVSTHPLGAELIARWSCTRLHTPADYRAALAASGFRLEREVDLTARVDLPTADRAVRARRLEQIRPLALWGGAVIDAFLGGLVMERLYAEGLLTYRCWVARLSP